MYRLTHALNVPEVMSSAEVDRKLWHGASAAGWTGKRYGKARDAAATSHPPTMPRASRARSQEREGRKGGALLVARLRRGRATLG